MVFIKKVEIYGFKSFGFTNTTVPFEPGLVSISGPNGSGKSNILDAIIFATGENRSKVLRVDKLRSLIHDEEKQHRGAKMARSSVHFDNSDRKIPVDADTVEITREMTENGENTYYLNKKKTNRSHILDLLDMANAGLDQINTVQQGTVTRISEFTSEEKRKTIEDLIGLSYFDEKKSESLKQLDDADRRLEIALAKMEEIKKRIDELDAERNQKLRHDLLEHEINRYTAISAANKLKSVLEKKSAFTLQLDSCTNKITELDAKKDDAVQQIHLWDTKKSGMMEKADEFTQSKSSIELQISSAMEQYEVEKSEITSSERRIEQIDIRMPEIAEQLEIISSQQNDLNQNIASINDAINIINDEKTKINTTLHDIDTQRNKILDQQSKAAAAKSLIDEKIQKLVTELNQAKLALKIIENEDLESQKKINTNSQTVVNLDVSSALDLKSKLESKMHHNVSSISELKSKINALVSRESQIHDEMDAWGITVEKSSKIANQYESKIKTIKGFMYEDYTVAKLKEDADKLGIKGLVYEMISWDKKYERCILAVSSDWIKAIVVKDFTTLLGIAQVAKNKKLSKLRIIPLDLIPEFKIKLPKIPGVIGILSNYVKCDVQYNSLKTFLFGNILIAKDKESAYLCSQSGYKTVTMDGEYFEAKSSNVIIDIDSKISKVTKLISMSSDIDSLFNSINLIKKSLSKKRRALEKTSQSINYYKDRLGISEKSLASINEQHENLVSRITHATKQKQKVSLRISSLKKRNNTISSEKHVIESQINSLEQRIEIVENNYAQGKQNTINSNLGKINHTKGQLEQKYTATITAYREKSSQYVMLQTQDDEKKLQTSRLHNDEKRLESERISLESKITQLKLDIAPKEKILQNLREQEQKLIESYGSPITVIQECDEHLKILSEQEKEFTGQINKLDRSSDTLNRDLLELKQKESELQKIISIFGLDRDIDIFDVEPIIKSLQAEQSSLDELNYKAPETYQEVTPGYRSMSTRKNSLEAERNSIVKFIENIDKDKRQTFLDAFDIVNKEIVSTFHKVTQGQAWLELQNEDDIFNAGISYLVQFPTKKKRESTAISGGEKTLAAIVFVLALQKLKPSPFYLFDEVDAHLDGPNAERLSKILKERSKESQFIMVSLKDSVVQKAELIYGVFPDRGVSKIVTYKDKRVPSVKTF